MLQEQKSVSLEEQINEYKNNWLIRLVEARCLHSKLWSISQQNEDDMDDHFIKSTR